jgi:[ribosomal protein S5]-alanine N-acetyltransferase
MIYFENLTSLSTQDKYKFIKWKKDLQLCDLIMSSPVELTIDGVNEWIYKNSNDANQFFKSVVRVEDKQVIGLARLMFIDNVAKHAEIGLYIGDSIDRSKNAGVNILNLLLQVAESKYRLNKVYAKIHEGNMGSIRLFCNAGFIKEGTLRQHYYSRISNCFKDVYIYSTFLK